MDFKWELSEMFDERSEENMKFLFIMFNLFIIKWDEIKLK